MKTNNLKELSDKLKFQIIKIAHDKQKGSLGGTLSCLDILVVLYFYPLLNVSSTHPDDRDRDRFILSKGHACVGLYLILQELNFIDKKTLDTYGDNNGLGAQLDYFIPGVDWNTGSLGHALGVISGMALSAKMNAQNYHSYTILGDAEMSEGSVWEALTFIGDNRIQNLTCIVDRNRLSVTEKLEDDGLFRDFHNIMNSLGWKTYEIDGHDYDQIIKSIQESKKNKLPSIILANTIKGKGISFMENNIKWHGAIPSDEEVEIARRELNQYE